MACSLRNAATSDPACSPALSEALKPHAERQLASRAAPVSRPAALGAARRAGSLSAWGGPWRGAELGSCRHRHRGWTWGWGRREALERVER